MMIHLLMRDMGNYILFTTNNLMSLENEVGYGLTIIALTGKNLRKHTSSEAVLYLMYLLFGNRVQ